MARSPLLTRISLDQIKCNEEGDGFGSAEPYLWTVFFKIDGDSVIVSADTSLKGECTIVASDGSHGNLGDRDVDAGDTLVVPWSIGEFRTTLRPIPLSWDPDDDVPGVIGVVLALLEEDQVTDAGARAGYAALVDFVRKEINRIIPTLNINKQEVSDDEIAALIDKAFDTVEDAIINVQSAGDNFWSWVDGDDTIGVKVLRWSHDALVDNYWDINERFQKVVNGAVSEDWQVLGESQGAQPSPYNYTHARRSEDVGSPAAAGAPTTCLHPAQGTQNIVYRDTKGHLHELWRDAIGQVGTTDLTANAGAPTAASNSNPYAYLETTTDLEIVPYLSGDGGLHTLYWSTGSVGLDNLSSVAGSPGGTGSAIGHFNPATNTHHIVYRSGDGHLHVVYWTGADDPAHYEGPLTAGHGIPRTAGDPSAYFNAVENVVVYRATDKHLHTLYWSTGPLGHEDLTGSAWPAAVGDPVAFYIPGADLQQVVYRADAGHLWELYWRGGDPAAGWDLMERSGAPEAVSDPAVFYSAGTNTKHAIYRGPFSHLYEIWWPLGGQPGVVDLTVAARAPRAVDRPAAFTVDAANIRYAVYRGVDNQIHEISWTANPWAVPRQQSDWRWCNRCQGLFYGGGTAQSRCPTGGTHTPMEQSGSFDYILPVGTPITQSSQPDWRWCNQCQGLFYGPNVGSSSCPTGGTHTPAAQSGSWDYVLPFGAAGTTFSQPDWRWCNRCQGLFYGGNVASSRCPTGGTHTPAAQSGSFDYVLPYQPPIT